MSNPINTPMAKPKKCKICKADFTPRTPTQMVCSWGCASAYTQQLAEKRKRQDEANKRKEYREAKEKQKTRADWMREAQQVINKYVRLRDYHKGCVSCDKPATWSGQWHASHFKSVGANSALRFNLWNIHKSCSQCNKWLSGNISEYTKRIVDRIGSEKLAWLETHNISRRYDVEYLKRLKLIYSKKCRILEKRLLIR